MTETTMTSMDRPTYGNWIASRSPGLFGAGLLGTVVLFGSLLASLLALLAGGPKAALVVAALGVVAFTAVGTPVGGWVARRVTFAEATRVGDTTHRSGLFTRKPDAHVRLPGMLGRSELLTAQDPFTSFVVIRSTGGLYTMVARCSAEGPLMQNQDRINARVASYSSPLSMAGQESGLVCAKAITDTAPDPGGRLPAMVIALRSQVAPAGAAGDERNRGRPAGGVE